MILRLISKLCTLFFFIKKTLYKNIEAENGQKLKTTLEHPQPRDVITMFFAGKLSDTRKKKLFSSQNKILLICSGWFLSRMPR